MSAESERVKRCRQRKRRGRSMLAIEVDIAAAADLLVAAGYLAAWDCTDRERVRISLQEARLG
jgi:hypothetical protein